MSVDKIPVLEDEIFQLGCQLRTLRKTHPGVVST
jgi:hypothetical protein